MSKFVLFVVMLCVCSSIYAGETEFWNTNSFNFFVDKKTTVKIVQEFRFDSQLNTFVQYVGLNKVLDENLSVAISHKLVEKHKPTNWIESHRIVGDITIKKDFSSIVFTNRNRVEYGLTDPLWLYRNRSKINFSPVFIANESFFKLHSSDGFCENRLSIGTTSSEFLFGSKISLYYMLRTKKSVSWKSSKILGLVLNWKF